MSETVLSPDQLLAKRVADHPGDEAARLELARLYVRRGQLNAAHVLLERLAPDAPSELVALRDRLRRSGQRPVGVAPPVRTGWLASGCISLLLLGLVGAATLVVLASPAWGGYLLLLRDRRSALAQLRSSDARARIEAARRLERLHGRDRPSEVGAAIATALADEPFGQEPEEVESILCTWTQHEALARALRHPVRAARIEAAEHVAHHGWRRGTGEVAVDSGLLARAAHDDPEVARRVVRRIASTWRAEDADLLVHLAEASDPELRKEARRAITFELPHHLPPRANVEPDSRLVRIALASLDAPDRDERRSASLVGLWKGDERALEVFLELLRRQDPRWRSTRHDPYEVYYVACFDLAVLRTRLAAEKDRYAEMLLVDAIELRTNAQTRKKK